MAQQPTHEFQTLAKEVAKSAKPQSLTVRALLAHFGQERRGSEVVRLIRSKLTRLGVETEPPFDAVHLDTPVKLLPRRSRPARPTAGAAAAKTPPEPAAAGAAPLAPVVIKSEEAVAEEARCPYLMIGLLASANRKPHSVRRDDKLETAVTLMLMHRISHVPVMQGDRNVEGLITWRSIGSRQASSREPVTARDCMEQAVQVVRLDTPLLEAVRDILQHGAVLVQAQDKTICGLVTAHDIAGQFVALSEPFLYLEQIENHLRSLLLRAKLTAAELAELVDPADAARKQRTKTVDDLSFGEYLRGLGKEEYWSRLKIGIDRALFVTRLDAIRQIRNSVMHFHPDGITASDREVLARTREMLQGL